MSRWRNARIRTKVATIVVVSAIGLACFALLRVADKVDAAATASEARTLATLSVRAGNLLHETQRERGRTSQFMSSNGTDYGEELAGQRRETDAKLAAFRLFLADNSSQLPQYATTATDGVLGTLDAVPGLRSKASALQVKPAEVIDRYTALNSQILNIIALVAANNGAPTIVVRLQAYLSFLTAKESAGIERAQLSNVFITGTYSEGQYIAVVSLIAAQQDSLASFERVATPDVREYWKQAQTTPAFGQVVSFQQRALALPSGGAFGIDRSAWFDTITIKIDKMKEIEDYQAETVAALAKSEESAATLGTQLAVGLAVLVFIITVLLAWAVSRSIVRPVQRLTDAAKSVADLTRAELERVADAESTDEQELPRFVALDASSDNELGELAGAFNRVQTTAAQLVERQIVSRRNVSMMFSNVAQRTQNLVNRQLAIVDELERDEQNTKLLASLYRLDHLSTRLRRNARNLLVVSGAQDEARMSRPMPLATALRAALAEIEDFRRVRFGTICDVQVAPSLVADLILVFAELLENAAVFSPPESFVDVRAKISYGGCQISIVDHGIGIAPDRLTEENHRLVERERLDVAPTGFLGLFVVGRLARRHGLTIELTATSGGGTTARISIPSTLFQQEVEAPVVSLPTRYATPAEPARQAPVPLAPAILLPPALAGDFPWFPPKPDDPEVANTNGRALPTAPPGPVPRPSTRRRDMIDFSKDTPATTADLEAIHNGLTAGVQPPADEADSSPSLPAAPPESARLSEDQRRQTPHPTDTPAPTADTLAPHNGLVRRTRGAQLPTPTPLAERKAATQPVQDPAAARAAMDGFQSAVATAPQRGGLARRVPGTNLAPELRDRPAQAAPVQPVRAAPSRNAEAQRNAFDSFTTGMAQAVADAKTPSRSDAPTDHGSSQENQR